MVLIVKRKIANLFHPQDRPIITEAVHDVHTILFHASRLIRFYYLLWFHKQEDKKTPKVFLNVDDELIRLACVVVQGDTFHARQGKNKEEKVKLFKELKEAYIALYSHEGQEHSPPIYKSNHSLYPILTYNCSQLETAYKNNVQEHFMKYPKKFIKYDLLNKGVPKAKSARLAWKITNAYMLNKDELIYQDEEIKADEKLLDDIIEVYSFLFPDIIVHETKEGPRIYNRYYDQKAKPMHYLYYMTWINHLLETSFPPQEEIKLYQPLPFHKTSIPMHIRLDTSGLSQLLLNNERIARFREYYKGKKHCEPNVKSKTDFLSSTSKIFEGISFNEEEKHDYATEIWFFLTNMPNYKHYNALFHTRSKSGIEYVFDHAIITDGISVNFQITEKCNRKRKSKFEPQKTKPPKPKQSLLPSNIVTECNNFKQKKILGCDLGKHNIAFLTDGLKSCQYTRCQRNYDTHLKTRRKVSLEKRKSHNIAHFETDILSKYPTKTCFPEVFQRYCQEVQKRNNDLESVYKHPYFRQAKYLVYTSSKSSEMRFMDKIHKTFSHAEDPFTYKRGKYSHCLSPQIRENIQKEAPLRSDIIIAIGTGGSGMNNLKGTPSAPFKGIQKRMLSFYPHSQGQEESYTSKTCPSCKTISLRQKDCIHGLHCKNEKERGKSYSRRGLLCCTNTHCKSSYWNRDLAGAFNILTKFTMRLQRKRRIPPFDPMNGGSINVHTCPRHLRVPRGI